MSGSSNICDVKVNLPYPPVQAESRRVEDAYAMLSNVGSGNSEMTAVSLYFYNSVILTPNYAFFARCFHEISIVEMHHLDMFANLAFQMGLDPRLWSMEGSKLCYWTPAYNRYPWMIREVIENAIKGERAAIAKYSAQAETIPDRNIGALLNRIILDERRHIEIFHKMLEQLP